VLLIWKGASSKLNKLSEAEIIGAILGTGAGVGLLVVVFFCPFLYRKVVKEDWELKTYHIPLGPLLLRRPDPAPRPEGVESIQNYYAGHLTAQQLEAKRAQEAGSVVDLKKDGEAMDKEMDSSTTTAGSAEQQPDAYVHKSIIGPKPEGKNLSPAVLLWWLKWVFFRGVDVDVISNQKSESKLLSGDLEKMHARVVHYDNRAEYMYSFLQVMTAAAASFTHGANDVSNAIGPFATIYDIWSHGKIHSKTSPVPTWILAFGGGAIGVGLWTYGYNIMRNLGNRITLHSPSRGFSMELGACITVIMATRLKIPM
jgi:sodium-dependent phosphate transporter